MIKVKRASCALLLSGMATATGHSQDREYVAPPPEAGPKGKAARMNPSPANPEGK